MYGQIDRLRDESENESRNESIDDSKKGSKTRAGKNLYTPHDPLCKRRTRGTAYNA